MAELVVTGSVSPVGVVGEDLISLLFWNHSSRISVSLSRAAALPLAACRGASAGGICSQQGLDGGGGQCPHTLPGVSRMQAAGQRGSLCKAWVREVGGR